MRLGILTVDNRIKTLFARTEQLEKIVESVNFCKMNGLQAIVATHSPSIVSSHYDCVVDKGESYEGERGSNFW